MDKNIRRKVHIYLRAEESLEGTTDVTEGDFDGVMISHAESALVHYSEYFEGVSRLVPTTLHLAPEQITISRSGQVSGRMVFVPGEWTKSIYRSAMGVMEIGILTSELSCHETSAGMHARIVYETRLNGIPGTHHVMEIRVESE